MIPECCYADDTHLYVSVKPEETNYLLCSVDRTADNVNQLNSDKTELLIGASDGTASTGLCVLALLSPAGV